MQLIALPEMISHNGKKGKHIKQYNPMNGVAEAKGMFQ